MRRYPFGVLTRKKPLKRTPLKRTAFKRKPQKSETIQRGEREICTGTHWQRRREEVFVRASGQCQLSTSPQCLRTAPLHDVKDESGDVVRKAGHAHHLKHRKMGGGSRDDRLENLQWVCWRCHEEKHGYIQYLNMPITRCMWNVYPRCDVDNCGLDPFPTDLDDEKWYGLSA